MRNGMGIVCSVWLLLAGVAGTAGAEPVNGKAAKAMLPTGKGAQVEIVPQSFLADNELDIIGLVAKDQPAYAAIALSPDDGLQSEATVAGANFHDTDAAAAFALAGCDGLRKGATPCVVVALIRPKGWKLQPVQLGATATEAFRSEYLKAKAPKAIATSTSSGLWGYAAGDGAAEAAVADCTAKAAEAVPVTDCTVVIAD